MRGRATPFATEDDAARKIAVLIRQQYAANSGLPLAQFDRANSADYVLAPEVIATTLSERESLLRAIVAELEDVDRSCREGLLGQFHRATQVYLYRNNQFIQLAERHHADLARLYADYLADMARLLATPLDAEGALRRWREVVGAHLTALSAFVADLRAANCVGSASLVDRAVVCEEYAPALQLHMLGLGESALMDPILDVGCGNGALVAYLRDQGHRAYGIDRIVPPTHSLAQADWLTFDYGEMIWGTILSHMSFSNHFWFHHLYQKGEPEAYARTYRHMLGALVPSGQLCYTPGLPFIEPLLPRERYAILRRELTAAGRNAENVATGALYATQIVRMR